MRSLPSGIIVLTSAGLLLLGACSKEAKTTDSASTNSAVPPAETTAPLSYDASGKHYAAVVSERASGQYQVKITATIGSEKVDGRFKFDR